MNVTDDTAVSGRQSTPDSSSSPQISVLVLTYNTSWDRVRATLNSIILQKGISFEIIISDDCSQYNFFDEIKDFFNRNSFTNYQLIPHEHNIGTVKNLLETAKRARAEYIKDIGQGDMLFDEYVLKDSYEALIKSGASVCGSKYVSFEKFEVPIKLCPTWRMPQDPDIYTKGTPEQRKYSMVMENNYLHGPSLVYKREALIHYLKILVEAGVIYTEDVITWIMATDEERIGFFDRMSVYYESGIGFSSRSVVLMASDHKRVIEMLINRIKDKDPKFAEALQTRRVELEKIIATYDEEKSKFERRQKLRESLGFLKWFIIIPLRAMRALKKLALRLVFGKKEEKKDFYTETDAPTEFANLCISRQ